MNAETDPTSGTENITTTHTDDASPSATDGRMRAVVQDCYGDVELLGVGTIERPTIEPDEVLVRVAAAGVDRGVWHVATGKPYAIRLAGYGIRRPKQRVPGLDLAGTVVDVGAEVTGFAVGDEVYGIGIGSYAEYARAKASKLSHRPDDVTAEQAATLGVSGATASQALFDVGRAAPGQRVLVLGASGGVGSFAVQLAHAHGLHVTGVASGAKADFVRELGADVVLDYRVDDFTREVPFDLIVDTGGRNRLSTLRRALTRTGTLVIVGGEGGGPITGGAGRQLRAMLLSPFVSQRLTAFVSNGDVDGRTSVHRLAADGELVASVDRTYSLDHVADALRDLEAGRLRGKAVITI